MKIIEYNSTYETDVKILLQELQTYIALIDKDGYNVLTKDYREIYFKKTMKIIKKYDGKILLAEEKNKIIGLIIGIINNEEIESYDFSCPKRGRILNLIVTEEYRHRGIGASLLKEMEKHLKDSGCKGILVEQLSYNIDSQKFYAKNKYYPRTLDLIKKV